MLPQKKIVKVEPSQTRISSDLICCQDPVFCSVTQMDNSRTSTSSRKKTEHDDDDGNGFSWSNNSVQQYSGALLKRLNSSTKKIVKSKQEKSTLKIYTQLRYTPYFSGTRACQKLISPHRFSFQGLFPHEINTPVVPDF